MLKINLHDTILAYLHHIYIVFTIMVKKVFTIKLSDKRKEKLRLYADQQDKTMTQVIEEMIDKLKIQKDK